MVEAQKPLVRIWRVMRLIERYGKGDLPKHKSHLIALIAGPALNKCRAVMQFSPLYGELSHEKRTFFVRFVLTHS